MRKYVLAVMISGLFIYFLLSQIKLRDVYEIVAAIRFEYLVLAFMSYLVQYFARTLRFSMLLRKDSPDYWSTFRIICIHNFLNHVLPARLGESSYILLMNKRAGVPMARCFSSLFSARVFDLVSIASIFVFSLFSTKSSLMRTVPVVIASIALMGGFSTALYFAQSIIETILKAITGVVDLFWKTPPRWFLLLAQATGKFAADLNFAKEKRLFLATLALSLGIWFMNVSAFFILMRGFGLNLPAVSIALGTTGAALSNVLPINGFGSFGTLEAGWTLSFMLAGVDKTTSISTGFGIHVIVFVYAGLMALYGYMTFLRTVSRKPVETANET